MTVPRVVTITGATATGKSRVALDLAHALAAAGRTAEIISADSVQVYRHMNIGTDKLSDDGREGIVHHFLDVIDPDQTFTAAEFGARSREIIARNWAEGRATVIAGGTGFYLRALEQGLFAGPAAIPKVRERLKREAEEKGLTALHERLRDADPEAARRIHPNDPVRIIRALEVLEVTGLPISEHFARQAREEPPHRNLTIGLWDERDEMYRRINQRVDEMMAHGLVEEVERLRALGYGPEFKSQQALGYRQVQALLDGRLTREEAVYLIKRDTRRYARRQLTWLRKDKSIHWMPAADRAAVVATGLGFILGDKRPEPSMPPRLRKGRG